MKEKVVLIFFLLMTQFSCSEKMPNELNGQWYLANFDKKLRFDIVEIMDDRVTIIDRFGTKFYGTIEKEKFKIELPYNKTEFLDFNYRDSLLIVSDSMEFNRLLYQFDHHSNIDLLGLQTNVEYPFRDIRLDNKNELKSQFRVKGRKINIKVRNTANAKTLLMGSTELAISELHLYLPNSVCSGARPLAYRYDEVVIIVEKGASVNDLLILEQFLSFNNRIRNFILVTECKEIGKYSIVIDKRFYFDNDLTGIIELIDEYFSNKEALMSPAFLPPPEPPQSHKMNLGKYIKSVEGEIIHILDLDEFIKERAYIIRNRKKIVLKLSNNMILDEYIYILRDIQNLRLNGKNIKVHILN